MKDKIVQKKRTKLTVCLLVFVFAGPMSAAYLLYIFRDHFEFKTVQTGHLLTPPLSFESLSFFEPSFLGKWQLIYIHPSCQSNCKAPEMLERIHAAIGKENHRVQYRSIPFQTGIPKELQGSVAIIDPRGWLILHYPAPSNPHGVLKDMRQLLKYSHIG